MRNIRTLSSLACVVALFVATTPTAPAAQQNGARIIASPAAAPAHADKRARVKFRLDDGSQELVIALTDAEGTREVQAVVLNRFTPTSNRLPFDLDTIQILFPKTCQSGDTGLRTGMGFEALVYIDPSGSGDPANAMLVARQPFEIQPSNNRFQRIRLDTPVSVMSGDVWVGYTNSFSALDARPLFFAAVDTSSPSQGRSWIFYNTTSNFTGDVLSDAQIRQTLEEAGAPGNFLIRARGHLSNA